jgi:p-aminobenzoyl-glutamate transporter AbgT
VINLAEFKIVALMPFLTVLICAISLFPFVDIEWQIATLSFVATHNLFCGGDFSLLNYLQNNKHQGIVTYDDKEKKETYFYVEK